MHDWFDICGVVRFMYMCTYMCMHIALGYSHSTCTTYVLAV